MRHPRGSSAKIPTCRRGRLATARDWSLAEIWLRAHAASRPDRSSAPSTLNARALAPARQPGRTGELTVLLINQTRTLYKPQRQLLGTAAAARSPAPTSPRRSCRWARDRAASSLTTETGARLALVDGRRVSRRSRATRSRSFASTCRRLLSDEDFALVDAAYSQGFQHRRAGCTSSPTARGARRRLPRRPDRRRRRHPRAARPPARRASGVLAQRMAPEDPPRRARSPPTAPNPSASIPQPRAPCSTATPPRTSRRSA